MTSTHSIDTFAEATASTWTSHSTSKSHTIDYVAVKDEDATGIVCASALPAIDNGHMVRDHVPSAATFTFQAVADYYRPHCKRAKISKAQIQDPVNRVAFAKELCSTAASHIPSYPNASLC